MKQSFIDEIRSGSKELKVEHPLLYLNGNNTIAELSKELNLSVPTVTKLVSELMEDGFVADFGKQETAEAVARICMVSNPIPVILWVWIFATLRILL